MSLFDSILPINALNGAVSGVENAVVGAFGFGHTKSEGISKSSATLDQFKGEVLGKGNADANRFELMVSTPKCLAGNSNGAYGRNMQAANVRVESVQFPALHLITKQRNVYGAGTPMPVAANYGGEQGLTVTYLCDRNMKVKQMFDAWISSIVDTQTQTVAYPDTYTTNIDISQLDRLDWLVYTVSLKDAYPVAVHAMNASQHASEFQRVSVTFAYRKWQCNQVEYFRQVSAALNHSAASKGGNVIKSVSDQINQRASALQGIANKYGLTTSITPIGNL